MRFDSERSVDLAIKHWINPLPRQPTDNHLPPPTVIHSIEQIRSSPVEIFGFVAENAGEHGFVDVRVQVAVSSNHAFVAQSEERSDERVELGVEDAWVPVSFGFCQLGYRGDSCVGKRLVVNNVSSGFHRPEFQGTPSNLLPTVRSGANWLGRVSSDSLFRFRLLDSSFACLFTLRSHHAPDERSHGKLLSRASLGTRHRGSGQGSESSSLHVFTRRRRSQCHGRRAFKARIRG